MRTTLLLLLYLVIVVPLSHAHDIGVSKAELIDSGDGSYTLRVATGQGVANLFDTPRLPPTCNYAGSPRGTMGIGWKRFVFSCDEPLAPDDTLELPWQRDGIMLTARWADGSEARRLFSYDAGIIAVNMAELRVGSGSWQAAAQRYTLLGIEHILEGIDHLLFVLALLFIVRDKWMLIKTVTAFTLAHSITLGLATLGIVEVSPRPVEAIIALSIAFLAMEIIHARNGRYGLAYRAPWVVAFGFGLLHGFGFAGALSEIGLPESEIPIALLFFNIGVEIGQLLFIAVMLLTIYQLVKAIPINQYARVRVLPVYLIGTLGMYWFLERVGSILITA